MNINFILFCRNWKLVMRTKWSSYMRLQLWGCPRQIEILYIAFKLTSRITLSMVLKLEHIFPGKKKVYNFFYVE